MSTSRRKTRVVCISDTHNQTPKLPPGDVLIHAGDLTNQGSYTELKRKVEWLEKQDFEAKIVIAGTKNGALHFLQDETADARTQKGNHDITLDRPFFRENEAKWKWPSPQDTEACRKLLTKSKSITYLENESTKVRLLRRGTWFTVFGSPCTPKQQQQADWAFQYKPDEAEEVWNKIPIGVDIVVTHTPPKGQRDGVKASGQQRHGRSGCPALLRRLEQVRPMLNICGHIHSGRGVETVQWRRRSCSLQLHGQPTTVDSGTLVSSVQLWNDPGASSKKLSLVDLTTMRARAGRGSGSDHAYLTRQLQPDSRCDHRRGQPDASFAPDQTGPQPPSGGDEEGEKLDPTASLTDVALRDSEALWGGGGSAGGGAGLEHHDESDTGHGCPDEATQHLADGQRGMPPSGTEVARSQTTVINAAYLGPRVAGKTSVAYNKPIVVDVELPVWGSSDEPSAVYSRANVG